MHKENKENLLYIYWYTVQFAIYSTYFLIVLYIAGFTNNDNAKKYLVIIDNYAKIIVSLFLMWKFNLFRKKIPFTYLDRAIVFQSGLFLFLTTSLNSIIVKYLISIKSYILSFDSNKNKNKNKNNTKTRINQML